MLNKCKLLSNKKKSRQYTETCNKRSIFNNTCRKMSGSHLTALINLCTIMKNEQIGCRFSCLCRTNKAWRSCQMNKEKTIEELIYEETDKRLKEMAEPGYQFPERANKYDVIAIVVILCICLLLIILSMTGVII